MTTNKTDNKITLPTYFISHGGGPWPWLKHERSGYKHLEASLQELPKEIGITPKAILVISGHWEEKEFTVMSSTAPPMIYDYSGFPEHTYHIKYPAPGSPQLAHRVQELLTQAGFSVQSDDNRGFDHGVFTPLAVAYPEANVPIVQLSMRRDYDPEAHLGAGRALAPLRNEEVLILASGLSYHNLRQMGPQARVPSHEFDEWLTQTLCQTQSEARNELLRNWTQVPSARLAHPTEDHLIPLMVAVGAASEELGVRVYHENSFFGGIAVSSYRFGRVA
ncbi:dioxygenase [Ancylothrix sp. C2]|uniref:DODA-type extradiol aromatic ring-opening family dioxygenase n=1 Tax=Ancylothrix sp. D3o TaxID=2953691 RepID=UPI0021BB639E|nr:class III extradiol ring-cleavage dioxygenase [Ancylothrix sp. D3o]MCT7953046.1 dioxygenase [Ancylothrix sp. D3o]